jgi:hypothetical protein
MPDRLIYPDINAFGIIGAGSDPKHSPFSPQSLIWQPINILIVEDLWIYTEKATKGIKSFNSDNSQLNGALQILADLGRGLVVLHPRSCE